jgi:hypothetical protein
MTVSSSLQNVFPISVKLPFLPFVILPPPTAGKRLLIYFTIGREFEKGSIV